METRYDFGLVGLGVMGRNFILNVADNGFTAIGNDIDTEKVKALISEGGDTAKVNASTDIKTFTTGLKTPRKIMLLVPAGKVVDIVIENLLPHLEEGDIIQYIDEQRIYSMTGLIEHLSSYDKGETIKVKVLRDGDEPRDFPGDRRGRCFSTERFGRDER